MTLGTDIKEMYNGVWTDADTFNKKVKSMYLSTSTRQPERMYQTVEIFREEPEKIGVRHIHYQSPGTSHEWLTWQRSLHEFAPLLFK
jgi:enterochelin esterase family protein